MKELEASNWNHPRKKAPLPLKGGVFEATVRAALLYGAVTWSTANVQVRMLETNATMDVLSLEGGKDPECVCKRCDKSSKCAEGRQAGRKKTAMVSSCAMAV